MGKFGIGARVRDPSGDIATIDGKRKGERHLHWDDQVNLADCWWPKSELTVVPPFDVGDQVKFTTTEPGYSAVYHDGIMSVLGCQWINGGWAVDIVYPPFGRHTESPLRQKTNASSLELAGAEPAIGLLANVKVGDKVRLRSGVIATVIASGQSETYPVAHDRGKDGYHAVTIHGKSCINNDDMDIVALVEEVPAPVAAADTTLAIEAGKFYRTRDGRKVGPMENKGSYFRDGGRNAAPQCHYAKNGISAFLGVLPGESGREKHDLVAEWVDEPALKPQLKAGDRVIILHTDYPTVPGLDVGCISVIKDIDEDGNAGLLGSADDYGYYFLAEEFAPAPTDFQVGDVVRFENLNPDWWFKDGMLGEIESVSSFGLKYRMRIDGGTGYVNDEHIELVRRPPAGATPEPKFRAGDRVRVLRHRNAFGHDNNTEGFVQAGESWIAYKTNTDYWVREEDVKPAPILPLDSQVTLTGTVRGFNGDNASVRIGNRSYDFPLASLKAA